MAKIKLSGSNNIPILGTGTSYESRYLYDNNVPQTILDFSRKSRPSDAITTGDASLQVDHTNVDIKSQTWNDRIFQWAIAKNYLYGSNYVGWGLGFKNTADYTDVTKKVDNVGIGYQFKQFQSLYNKYVQNSGFLWDGDVGQITPSTTSSSLPENASVYNVLLSSTVKFELQDTYGTFDGTNKILTLRYGLFGNQYGRDALKYTIKDISSSWGRTPCTDKYFVDQQKNLLFVYLSNFPNFTDMSWDNYTYDNFPVPTYEYMMVAVGDRLNVNYIRWATSNGTANILAGLPYTPQMSKLKLKGQDWTWNNYNLIDAAESSGWTTEGSAITESQGPLPDSGKMHYRTFSGEYSIYHDVYLYSPLSLSNMGNVTNKEVCSYDVILPADTRQSTTGHKWFLKFQYTVHVYVRLHLVTRTDYWEYYWTPTTGSDSHAQIIQNYTSGFTARVDAYHGGGGYSLTYIGNVGCAVREIGGYKKRKGQFSFTANPSGGFEVVWGNGDRTQVSIPNDKRTAGSEFSLTYKYPVKSFD